MSKYPGRIVTDLAPAGYSVFFDGTGDYLSLPNDAAFSGIGSNDWTVEAWVYSTATATSQNIITISGNTGAWAAIRLELSTANALYLVSSITGSAWAIDYAAGTVTVNAWNHVAVTRSGTSVRLYVNGSQVGVTQTLSGSLLSGTVNRIGIVSNDSSFPFKGYISNVRYIRGTALYTGTTYLVPTQLFNVTNTQLLTCNSPALVDQSTNNFTITANGNAAVSTLTPFTAYVPYNPALGASTPGVWTLDEALQAKGTRQWNMYDPYFNLTTLLLHGNGTNTAQNNQFLDSSSNNFTITRNPASGPNAPTQGSFSPFSQTGWSYFGSATTDKLTASSVDPGNFGSSAFTVEAWVYFNDIGTTRVVASNYQSSTVGWTIYRNTSNFVTFHGSGDGADITSTTVVAVGRWYHIAVSGTPTSPGIRLFINGVQEGSTYTGAVSLNSTNAVVVGDGAGGAAGVGINGYISNLRLLKGTALYTTNFTPPTTPLTNITNTSLLTCQSNRFVDNGTANSGSGYTFTVGGTPSVQAFSPFYPTRAYTPQTIGGSGYFDGTGDYLSMTIGSSTIGAGDFTIELWYYPTAFQNYDTLFSTTRGANGFNIGTNASASVVWYSSSAEQINSGVLRQNAWNHIAFTRTSNTLRLYLNGSQTGATPTVSTNFSATTCWVGDLATSGTEPAQGYISGLRVVTQSLASGSTYTVPTAPPTAIANTSLLLNFTNAGIVDSTAKNVLETVGNAQISTTQSKFGGTSMSFDGTGDYLQIPSSNLLAFGSSPYTVELWLYPNNVANLQGLFTMGAFRFFQNATGLWFLNSSTSIINVATGLSTGQWFHIALVREGTGTSQTKLYLNGSSIGTGTDANTWAAAIAYVGSEGASNQLNGYIDDLRITRFARYTGNFTPQTSQWQDE